MADDLEREHQKGVFQSHPRNEWNRVFGSRFSAAGPRRVPSELGEWVVFAFVGFEFIVMPFPMILAVRHEEFFVRARGQFVVQLLADIIVH